VDIDLDEIRRRGKLVALSGYGANSYFIYKGEPMGFEYELLQSLSRHLEVDLEIVVVGDLDNVFNLLNRGKGDLVAHNLTVTKDRARKVSFTAPLN
ncbi:MAG: transporter substrate-binding domain-containing protein, partial [Calditrichaeota bacterium]|nr:transporter substrate-binding domain-containing protein [Calditrichota bacterium]